MIPPTTATARAFWVTRRNQGQQSLAQQFTSLQRKAQLQQVGMRISRAGRKRSLGRCGVQPAGPLAPGTAGRVSAYRAGDSDAIPSAAFGDDDATTSSQDWNQARTHCSSSLIRRRAGTGYASSWWPTAVTRGGATSTLLVGGTVDTGTTNLPSGGAISGHIRGPGGWPVCPEPQVP